MRRHGYVGLFEALDHFHHASYVATGHAGHYLPLEEPRLFKEAVLSWLDECQPLLTEDQR